MHDNVHRNRFLGLILALARRRLPGCRQRRRDSRSLADDPDEEEPSLTASEVSLTVHRICVGVRRSAR